MRRQPVDIAKLAQTVIDKVVMEYPDLDVRLDFPAGLPKPYADQVRFATSLLKIYPEEVVFRALRQAPHVWSLGAAFFSEHLDKELKNYELEIQRAERAKSSPSFTTTGLPRAGGPSIRSVRGRLNQLDGQKNTEIDSQ